MTLCSGCAIDVWAWLYRPATYRRFYVANNRTGTRAHLPTTCCVLLRTSHDGIHKDRHVHTLMSAEDLFLLGPGPKVVLTTFPEMEVGISRHLFVGM